MKTLQLIFSIIGIIGIIPLYNFIMWRKWPLGISINSEDLTVNIRVISGGLVLTKNCPIYIFIEVNFTKKAFLFPGFDVSFSNFEFYPQKINDVEFEILNKIFNRKKSGMYTDKLFITGNETKYVNVIIKTKFDLKNEDFLKILKKHKSTFAYLKFNYTVAGRKNLFKK